MKIKDCKLKKAISCDEGENIIDVAKKIKKSIDKHVIVVTKDNKPIGIISVTDINNRVVAENKNLKTTKAKNIMTTPIVTMDINEELNKAYITLIKEGILFCPVMEKGKLKGILDLREAMSHLVKLNAKLK